MRLCTRTTHLAAATLAGTLALTLLPGAAHAADPSPGSPGIGDRLYPTLGNGGYDARRYSLRLRYATAADDQGIRGTVTMRAVATQDLSAFDLDFAGDGVGSVAVDGRPATWTLADGELVVTPARPIADGHRFRVRVRDFTSHPSVPEGFLTTPFVQTPDGSVTAGQPNLMHGVYPVNDHPRDKARYRIRFDVPRGRTAVANGVLVRRRTVGDRVISVYRQRQPMASELVSLSVGDFRVIHRRPVGRIAVRDVVPRSQVAAYRSRLGVVRGHLRWMQRQVGRYPFDVYGSLIARADLGFALENQTLSLFDSTFYDYPRFVWSTVMVHELAHQWFGDSVAPASWSDVWQNEGHATWYEYRYAAHQGWLKQYTGIGSLTGLLRTIYAAGDQFRDQYGPVARPLSGDPEQLFSNQVYAGGALVLYALRQKVGARSFDRIERAWVTAASATRPASSAAC